MGGVNLFNFCLSKIWDFMSLFLFLFFIFFIVYFYGFFFFSFLIVFVSGGFFDLSFFFLFLVLCVSLVVSYFSKFYLNDGDNSRYYYLLLYFFIFSIMGVILSVSSFFFILCWDTLGVISLLLILYYFSKNSLVGGLSTALSIRIGDFFLILLLSSFLFFSSFSSEIFFCFSSLFLLFLSIATNSAQYPFIGWLPRAMEAPTPVSALVHSSTLVTAGLVLLYSFSTLLFNYFSHSFFLLVGVYSYFFSSILSTVELDVNNLVALSTLSHISLCVLGIFFCSFLESYAHIFGHALVKSCLFLSIGYLIYISMGQQSSHLLPLGFYLSFLRCQIFVLFFGLGGLLWVSSSISKELLVSTFYAWGFSFIIFTLFFFSLYMTFFYIGRLWSSIISVSGVGPTMLIFSNYYLVSFFLYMSCIFFLYFFLLEFLFFSSIILLLEIYFSYIFLFGFFSFFFSYSYSSIFFFYNFFTSYFLGFFSFFLLRFYFLEGFLFSVINNLFSFFSFLSFYLNFFLVTYTLPLFLGSYLLFLYF